MCGDGHGANALWCNTLQRTATYCYAPQHTATHCNTGGHCNSLQLTATHCNTGGGGHKATVLWCYTLQHTAPHCNTLHHTSPHCNTLQRTATQVEVDMEQMLDDAFDAVMMQVSQISHLNRYKSSQIFAHILMVLHTSLYDICINTYKYTYLYLCSYIYICIYVDVYIYIHLHVYGSAISSFSNFYR